MMDAVAMTALTRSAAAAWVDREAARTGSRTLGYEIVAQSIGASASWLRKFVTEHAEVKQPPWTVGWNILSLYRRLCERVELETEIERAKARALRDEINAATQGFASVVAGSARTQAHRTAYELNPDDPMEPPAFLQRAK